MTPTAVDIAACDSTVGIGGGTRTVVVEGFAGTVIVRGGCSLRAGVGRNCLPLAVVVLASGAEMPASHSTSGTRLRRGSVRPPMARINSRGLRARYVGLELGAVGAVGRSRCSPVTAIPKECLRFAIGVGYHPGVSRVAGCVCNAASFVRRGLTVGDGRQRGRRQRCALLWSQARPEPGCQTAGPPAISL